MRHGDAAGFCRMLELFVAAFLCDFKPAVIPQALHDLATGHGSMIHTFDTLDNPMKEMI